jgi:hypothetical protein
VNPRHERVRGADQESDLDTKFFDKWTDDVQNSKRVQSRASSSVDEFASTAGMSAKQRQIVYDTSPRYIKNNFFSEKGPEKGGGFREPPWSRGGAGGWGLPLPPPPSLRRGPGGEAVGKKQEGDREGRGGQGGRAAWARGRGEGRGVRRFFVWSEEGGAAPPPPRKKEKYKRYETPKFKLG